MRHERRADKLISRRHTMKRLLVLYILFHSCITPSNMLLELIKKVFAILLYGSQNYFELSKHPIRESLGPNEDVNY